MVENSYEGNYNEVLQQIRDDYFYGDVELCSYFDTVAPNLTIAEAVRLFAALRKEIDGDTVLHIIGGDVIDLSEE